MSDQSLPPEAYGLGRPLAEYNTRRDFAITGFLAIVLGGICVGGVFAWNALGLLGNPGTEECLVSGLAAVGLGLLLSVAAAFMGRRRVVVFAEGMVHTRRGKHTVVRWDDVERVLLYGSTAPARRCTVQTKYGDRLVIADSMYAEGRQLADTIREEVTKRKGTVYVVYKPLTTVDSSGNVVPDIEGQIASKVNGSLFLLVVFGWLVGSLVFCPLAIIRTTQALRLIEEKHIGEEYRAKAKIIRAIAVLLVLFWLGVIGFFALVLLTNGFTSG